MSRKKINIGLFGFGCVGYGLYEVLEKTPALSATISKICVKNRRKERPLADGIFTFNKLDILNDASINVVVELIDDADAAFEIVSEALKKGKSVVSANKKMIAEHFSELHAIQTQTGSALLYEGACCASIPIIRNLEEYYDNDLLENVEGIVNGSTNYILTKITNEGLGFQEALQQAQQKGYAESNPELDISGSDANYKLLILLAHAFGLVTSPSEIFTIGIDRLEAPELQYAREKKLKIKLVASACKNPSGKISALVMPKFVSGNNNLFSVDDAFNGVKTRSVFSDSQFFVGKGAGAYPTASAVLSDISALTYDYRYEYKKLGQTQQLEHDENVYLKVLVRLKNQTHTIRYCFADIEEERVTRNGNYIVGTVTLAELKRVMAKYKKEDISVVLFETISDPENRYRDLALATHWL